MAYPFYILFGLAPSIIWLLFYLRKDAHPEPNRLILKIFFLGSAVAVLAAFLELGFFELSKNLPFSALTITIINIFLGVALIEEMLKYLIVRWQILGNPEFDEPVDAMLYMIIAALGFAALENTLILWFNQKPFALSETITWSAIRFLGATFLHALCSGIVGYFLAISCFKQKELGLRPSRNLKLTSHSEPSEESRPKLRWSGFFGLRPQNDLLRQPLTPLVVGLGLAVLLHGLYNFSIMEIKGSQKMLLPIIILIGSAVFVSWGFRKLKRLTLPF